MRIHSILAVILWAALVWPCAAADDEVVMSFPMFIEGKKSTIEIVEVDQAKRQVRISPGKDAFAGAVSVDSVLLLQDPGTLKYTHAVPVRIDEILDKAESLATFGPGAAKVVRPGPVAVTYPFQGMFSTSSPMRPVTTKQIRALPDVIEIGPARKAASDPKADEQAKREADLARTVDNFKRIMLALHNFESAYGHFPPAVIYGPDGKPWHSWRVLLLPFLEQGKLYDAYDFRKPWDDPANRKVVETVVEVYRNPVYGSDKPVTHFAAVVGDTTMFPAKGWKITDPQNPLNGMSAGGRNIREITDGLSNTIGIVPAADGAIPWAKPEDIAFGPDFPAIGKPGGIAAPFQDPNSKRPTILFAMADGSVRLFALDPPAIPVFRAMATCRGGETVNFGDFDISDRLGRLPTLDSGFRRQGGSIFRIVKSPQGEIYAVIE
jgi:hypothetical protein